MPIPANSGRFDDESSLVLLLSDPHLTPEDLERVRALCLSALDWNRVLGMLILHRTSGQAWVNLSENGLATSPSFPATAACRTLRSVFKIQRLYVQEQIDRNIELINRFEAAGIRCLLMKGAAVARMGYTQLGVRTFNDNDFLFDRDDIARVGEILKDLGYRQGSWDPQARVVRAASRSDILLHPLTSHETFPYIKATLEAVGGEYHCVDVHFSVDLMTSNRNDENVRTLIGRRVAVPGTADRAMWALDREDMFVFLCVHYQREASSRREAEQLRDMMLYKLMDLLALLGDRGRPLDVDLVARRAMESGFEREVFFALAHLEELYPGRVPAGLSDQVRPSGSVEFVHQITHNGAPVFTWKGPVADRFFVPQRLSELARG